MHGQQTGRGWTTGIISGLGPRRRRRDVTQNLTCRSGLRDVVKFVNDLCVLTLTDASTLQVRHPESQKPYQEERSDQQFRQREAFPGDKFILEARTLERRRASLEASALTCG